MAAKVLTTPPGAHAKPALTIRSHLFLLALAAVVPILAFAIAVSWLHVEQGNELIRNGAMGRARALMTAIDADLRGSITTLEALATSSALEKGDLRAFHEEAVRVQASQRVWRSINLALPDNFQQIVNSAQAYGVPLYKLADTESAERLLKTGRPVIGNVTTGPLLRRQLVAVRAPVFRNGKISYILTALLEPESLEKLISQQSLPEGWVIGIVDQTGHLIARVPKRDPGTLASEAFRERMQSAQQGWYRGQNLESLDTFTAYLRSDFSHWTIGFAIPANYVLGGAQRTAWLLGLGALSSIVIALLIAFLIGRRIAEPIVALASAARGIGRGGEIGSRTRGRVSEVAQVADALKEASGAVLERQALIEREKTALMEADRAKDQFIAMLSHELRNPLSALTTAAHLLKLAGADASVSEHARGVIERQARHMTRLIEDLLDINRVSMGKVTLIREPLDLGELISEVVRTWRASGRLASHTVEVSASKVIVDVDRARMEQVFSNLLDNALKFTPAGRKVTVTVGQAGHEAVLCVADEGEGIEPALMPRIFGLFVQGPQSLDRQSGGLGVGLALVKGLVGLHGGDVTASSEGQGRGAQVTVRLPALKGAVAPAILTAGVPVLRGKSRRILVVEDNEDARKMLKVMLELTGNAVSEAGDSSTGLRMAIEQRPDVMIIDIGLPDMDGYELATRIRGMDWGREVLLIALTGYGQAEDKRRALEVGFDAHATKPVLPEYLSQIMEPKGRASEGQAA